VGSISKPNKAPLNPAKIGLKPKPLVNSVLDITIIMIYRRIASFPPSTTVDVSVNACGNKDQATRREISRNTRIWPKGDPGAS
jgi:hypothetical protein